MLRHRLAQGADLDTRLVLSVRTEEDLLYRDELAEWEAAGVDVAVTLTRAGQRRRVDAELLAERARRRRQRPHVFVCGPTAFVGDRRDAAAARRPRPRAGADRALRRGRVSLLPSPA